MTAGHLEGSQGINHSLHPFPAPSHPASREVVEGVEMPVIAMMEMGVDSTVYGLIYGLVTGELT